MEMERPSASYVVDVSIAQILLRLKRAADNKLISTVCAIDAPTDGANSFPRRYDTCATPASVDWKVKKTHRRSAMDAGREAVVDRRSYWRVYALERHRFQFRDSHGCESCRIAWMCLLTANPHLIIGTLRSNPSWRNVSRVVSQSRLADLWRTKGRREILASKFQQRRNDRRCTPRCGPRSCLGS